MGRMAGMWIVASLVMGIAGWAQEARPAPAAPDDSAEVPSAPGAQPLAVDEPATEANDAPVQRLEHVTVSVVVKVANPEVANRDLAALAERLGGHPSEITDGSIALRVPREKADAMAAAVEQVGTVLTRQMTRTDVTLEVETLRAQLVSAQQTQRRLVEMLARSKLQETLDVARQLMDLALDIERKQGRLRFLEANAQETVFTVSYDLPEDPVVVDKPSRFDWLNAADIDRFLEDFE